MVSAHVDFTKKQDISTKETNSYVSLFVTFVAGSGIKFW